MDFSMPVRLYTGRNCLALHSHEFSMLGRKCMILTGAHSAKASGALDDVLSVLSTLGIEFTVFDKISQNPLLSLCAEAGREAYVGGDEFLIGIGGGSVLDATKAAAVFSTNPGLDETGFYSKEWDHDPLPIILIGTTAGTGSEVTKVSVVTDSSGKKHSIHDDRIYARAAFGDPSYTMSIPRSVTLSTGIDILAHCTESYFSKKANDISAALAVQGIRKLLSPFYAVLSGEELTYIQREQLYEASILGGLAICVTGTCFPHTVGYFFTENYHIPHGFACVMLFPEFIRHAETADPEYASEFFHQIGISADELISLSDRSLSGIKISLTEEEVSAALPRWENNNSLKATIGNITVEDIHLMLRKFIR